MRSFAPDALEDGDGASAPDLHARAAIDAFKHADIFDRQDAFLALIASAARATDGGRFGRHNGLKLDAQR